MIVKVAGNLRLLEENILLISWRYISIISELRIVPHTTGLLALLSLTGASDLISVVVGDKGLFCHLQMRALSQAETFRLSGSCVVVCTVLAEIQNNVPCHLWTTLLSIFSAMVSFTLLRPELRSPRLQICTLGKFSSLARVISTTLHSLPVLSSR